MKRKAMLAAALGLLLPAVGAAGDGGEKRAIAVKPNRGGTCHSR